MRPDMALPFTHAPGRLINSCRMLRSFGTGLFAMDDYSSSVSCVCRCLSGVESEIFYSMALTTYHHILGVLFPTAALC